jgi:superfamily II DNA or RNA helicase
MGSRSSQKSSSSKQSAQSFRDLDHKITKKTCYSFPLKKTNCCNFPSRKNGKRPTLSKTVKHKRCRRPLTERVLRYWQSQAFNRVCNSRYFLVKAFCGSGKTTLSIVLALNDIIKNNRKQIFIVPQEHIGGGFATSGKFKIPGIGVVELTTPKNFCESSENKIESFVNFLRRKFSKDSVAVDSNKQCSVDGENCMAVVTLHCFNAAMNKIIEKGLFDEVAKNTSFFIDEAHHIKGGELEIDEDYNQLGKIVYKILDNAEKNNSAVRLTTATFNRGDQGIIVKSDYLKKFDRFDLDFIDHFATLDIKKVFVNFEEYEDDPIFQIVENIRQELKERHLIVVPSRSSKWRKTDINLERLKEKLFKMLIEEGVNPNEVILDLVTESTQKQNKAILLKEPKERYDENPDYISKIRVVITCMLGREGTDWCPCSRIHHASIELGSTTLAIQTLGRLFRKFKGKDNVAIIYYIKKFNPLKESANKKEFISDRVNAMLCLMIIDDLMQPIMILPNLPSSAHKGPKRKHNKTKKNDRRGFRLGQIFGEENFENIKREIFEKIFEEENLDEESVNKVILEAIKDYKFLVPKVSKENVIAGLKTFLLRARSEALRSKGINIADIRKAGFDAIVEKQGLRGSFWCGELSNEDFKEFKRLVGKKCWPPELALQIVENIKSSLAEKIGEDLSVPKRHHEQIIRKTLKEFSLLHEAYNKISDHKVPSKEEVAKLLRYNISELNKKVKMFNEILPGGYKFFFAA